MQVLKQHHAEAMRMLNVIKNSYSTFHNAMLRESKKLPASLVSELDSYDAAICLHLGVTRQALKQSQSVGIGSSCKGHWGQGEGVLQILCCVLDPMHVLTYNPLILQKSRVTKTPSKLKMGAPVINKTLSKRSSSFIKASNKLVIVVSSTDPSKKPRQDGEEEERAEEEEDESITYLIKAEPAPSKEKLGSPKKKGRKMSDGIFMTQDEDMEAAHIALAMENIVLAGGAITEVKHQYEILGNLHVDALASELG